MLNILGPSGVGKGTIIKQLQDEFGGKIKFSVSHTTRSKREGEVDGVNYHFVTVDAFKSMIEKDELVEYACYNNNYYGTSKNELLTKKSSDSVIIFDIDIVGAKKISELKCGVEFIALIPPNIDILKERLIKRGTESEDIILKRLEIAKAELEEIDQVDFIKHRIVNDDFIECYKKVRALVVELFPVLNN